MMNEPHPSPAAHTDPWANQPPNVRAIHARLLRVVPAIAAHLRPDATLPECGADSLDLVELMCAVETDYGVRLTTDEIAALPNVGAFFVFIDARASRRPSINPV